MTTTIERLNSNALDHQAERRARLGMIAAQPSQASVGGGLAGWMKSVAHLTPTMHEGAAMKEVGVVKTSKKFAVELHDTERLREIRNSMRQDQDDKGGYLTPGGIIDRLEAALADHSAIRSVATVERTNHSGESYLPIIDDPTGEGEIVGGEPETTESDFSFGASEVGYRLFGSKIAKISEELLSDGVFRPDRIATALATRISRIQNRHWTQVRLVPAVNVTVTAGSATAISYSEIIDLIYSLDTAYRESPTAGFMAHGDVGKQLMKLTVEGMPIFRRGSNGNGWLCGYPIRFNSHMAAPATTVKSLLFGDFPKALLVADVRELRFKQLDERYATSDTIGFTSFLTSGFSVIQPASVNAIVALQQA